MTVSGTAPAVSVLLPVRDGGIPLYEAIDSMSSQTFGDFEVMAVDDGSADGTYEVLDEWSERDARVRVIRQEPAGIVAALERARSAARGRYLARMDSDDVAHPSRLEKQLALLESDSLVGCGCAVEYFPAASVGEGARRYERWINAAVSHEEISREMFVECPLAHPTFFMRADAVADVGGYRDKGWPEDYDLILRLWARGGRLGKVPETLLRWREGPDRLSRNDRRYAPEAFLQCKVYHLRRTLLRDRDRVVIWGAGPIGKALGVALIDAGTELVAYVEVDPRKVGQDIHGARVVDTEAGLSIRDVLHLAAVGQVGAREHLRATLGGAGLREMEDFVAVA